MMDQNWCIAICTLALSLSLPATVSIYKFVPRRRDDVATFREVQQLRKSIEDRLEAIERDQRRIAVKLGFDLWGS